MSNILTRFWDRLSGKESERLQKIAKRAIQANERFVNRLGGASSTIQAAAGGGTGNYGWTGTPSNYDEDAANKEYLHALADVLQRSQDLDVNNSDLRGFHRTRTAQILGAHVRFKSCPQSDEVGIPAAQLAKIAAQIDRCRILHSKSGGFDSTGNRRSEGVQQVRAQLTALIHGACLIHRVWQPNNAICPLSLELIPGVRISTPYNKMGDPKISYGIEYTDDHRTKVVAFHVRNVAKTIGNQFVIDPTWRRLPIEDCSLLSLTEPAGMDRAMPLCVAVVRMLRNRGEFLQSSVAAARAQARQYGAVECGKNADPWTMAADDTDTTPTNGMSAQRWGFTTMGDAQLIYLAKDEKMSWMSAKLPGPDFEKFMGYTDEVVARGLHSSLSRFTRRVNSSWAGGRLEDQQDDPLIDQYRQCFMDAWSKVNEWFLEALWISGKVELPGYSSAMATHWAEFRATFPGKLHINPTDTMKARETGFMLRTTTPQHACEEDGTDLLENLRQWGAFMKLRGQVEKEFDLDPNALDILFSGKAVTSSAGADIAPAPPEPEAIPGETPPAPPAPPAKKNGQLNGHRMREYIP